MTEIGTFSWIAYYIWFASEIGIAIRTKWLRQNISATKLDKGSSWFIFIGITVGIGMAFIFHSRKWGWVSWPIASVGAAFMLIGIFLRLWSILVLGRNFSAVVSIELSQTLVQSGPYKIIRHPAYTGSLITLTFLGLAFNSWIASCVLFITFLVIYAYRIYVEEKALLSHFQSAYEDYRMNTWRIIPYVW